MTLVKVSMEFEIPDWGWTETFFLNDGFFVTLSQDYGVAVSLCNARAALMPPSITVRRVRMSVDGMPRVSRSLTPNEPWGGVMLFGSGTFGPSNTTAAEISTCIRLNLEAGDSAHGTHLLRGLPEEVVGPNTTYLQNAPGWRSRLDNFRFQFLTPGSLWCLRHRSPGNHAGVAGMTIQPDARGIVIYATDILQTPAWAGPVRNVQRGDKVVLTGFRQTRNINGVWLVNIVGAGGSQLTLSPHRALVQSAVTGVPPITLPGNPQVAVLGYQGFLIDAVGDEAELVNKKTGRPFGRPRGRRSVA